MMRRRIIKMIIKMGFLKMMMMIVIYNYDDDDDGDTNNNNRSQSTGAFISYTMPWSQPFPE